MAHPTLTMARQGKPKNFTLQKVVKIRGHKNADPIINPQVIFIKIN
jgi:hypothetical protein